MGSRLHLGLCSGDRGSTPRMILENSVSVQEILPGWVSINWSRVRGRIAGYYVHCKDLTDENSDWIQVPPKFRQLFSSLMSKFVR